MTWGWLVTVAAWVFLAGVTMAAASPLRVLLAWLLPRLA